MFGVFLILELMPRDLQGSTGENYIPQDAMFLRDSFQTTCRGFRIKDDMKALQAIQKEMSRKQERFNLNGTKCNLFCCKTEN